jgi:hypothetical protein
LDIQPAGIKGKLITSDEEEDLDNMSQQEYRCWSSKVGNRNKKNFMMK